MANSHKLSIVQYYGERYGRRCGYCKEEGGKCSHGMWAHTLTVQDYQDLLDRGWRRSGKYCYKPSMDLTCCPQYTIYCDALNYKLSQSHKKVIKKLNKYLNTGDESGRSRQSQNQEDVADVEETPVDDSSCDKEVDIPVEPVAGSSVVDHPDKASADKDGGADQTMAVKPEGKQRNTPKPGLGPDPNRPVCKKAKLRRMEKRRQRQGQPEETQKCCKNSSVAKTLEDILNEVKEDAVHKLELRLVRSYPRSKQFKDAFDESYAVYKKYQMEIHKDPPDKPTEKQYTRFLVDSPLEMRLIRSHPQAEDFVQTYAQSYAIYQKYQMVIHKDAPSECDEKTYKGFLVDSPLQPVYHEGGFPEGFGSFHQQYLLDGKIIAVGVLDILPSCISSKYFYYDPQYEFLSLGTYSALREIALTRHLHAMEPSIKYYYIGYYVPFCPKMLYKAQYRPSFLLCPEAYTWQPTEKCQLKLDVNKYSRFDETDKKDEDQQDILDPVLVLHQHQAMPYAIYRMLNPDATDEDEVKQYAGFVGKKCANRMLLYRA